MSLKKKHWFSKDSSHLSKWALMFTASLSFYQLYFTPYQKHLRYFPRFHGSLLSPNFMVNVAIHHLKGLNLPSPGLHFLNVAYGVVSQSFCPRVKHLYPRHLCDFWVTLSFLNLNDLMIEPWPLKKDFKLKSAYLPDIGLHKNPKTWCSDYEN